MIYIYLGIEGNNEMWSSVCVKRSGCVCFHEKESGYIFRKNQRKVRFETII